MVVVVVLLIGKRTTISNASIHQFCASSPGVRASVGWRENEQRRHLHNRDFIASNPVAASVCLLACAAGSGGIFAIVCRCLLASLSSSSSPLLPIFIRIHNKIASNVQSCSLLAGGRRNETISSGISVVVVRIVVFAQRQVPHVRTNTTMAVHCRRDRRTTGSQQ